MKIKLFHHKHKEAATPMPLRIEGVGDAPMTPEPDDAEIAAQAILEIMLEKKAKEKKHRKSAKDHKGDGKDKPGKDKADTNSVAYYQHLSKHIGEAYREGRQRALRFTCYCEQQLADPSLPLYGKGSLSLLEAELYKRLDVVEREGGDLKKRWQHCLAEVTIRLMNASTKTNDKH